MAFCINCGQELTDGSKFCAKCGKEAIGNNTYEHEPTQEYDVTVTPKVKLCGPRNEETEICVFIPHLGKSIRLWIPNSIEVGQSFRIRGEGLHKPDGGRGDLFVTPAEIEYYDTEMTISVHLTGELSSATKMPLYLPHTKKTVQISVPNNITSEKTLRLKGLGLSAPNGKNGDLYLHFAHIDYIQEPVMPPKYEAGRNFSERKQEYAGKIIKCPVCGAVLSSFSAICPDCGHEINSQKVSPYIRDFSRSIDTLDQLIANDPEPPKAGWASWKKGKKFLWVVINLLTFGIPLIFYLTWPLIKPFLFPNKTPTLSSAEKRKAALIENFTFPNERESIIEALLFIKSKISFLSTEKTNKKTLFWLKLWNTKADQLIQRAGFILKNDTIVDTAIADIAASNRKVRKNARMRAIIGAAIIVASLSLVCIYSPLLSCAGVPSLASSEITPTLTPDSETNEDEGIYAYEIRNYVGRNVASFRSSYVSYDEYFIDNYGEGKLRLSFVSEEGTHISPNDEIATQYIVTGQNLNSGSKFIVVHEKGRDGEPIFFVAYQSYDEIILYVSPIGNSPWHPSFTEILPTLDCHIYHIRDYIGRNAASFKIDYRGRPIDAYGDAKLTVVFSAEDGSYIDDSNIDNLKSFVVVAQDIAPNSELRIDYDTGRDGQELHTMIESQSYEQITLTVRPIEADPTIDYTVTAPEEDSSDDVEVSSTDSNIAVPEEFTAGYEQANFDRYNSPASENGLANSRIYFYGILEKTEILEADGTTTILGYVTDDSDSQWLIMLHTVPLVSESSFNGYIGKDIILRGVYNGFSTAKNMPVMILDEMIILDTGESVFGMQKVLEE